MTYLKLLFLTLLVIALLIAIAFVIDYFGGDL